MEVQLIGPFSACANNTLSLSHITMQKAAVSYLDIISFNIYTGFEEDSGFFCILRWMIDNVDTNNKILSSC